MFNAEINVVIKLPNTNKTEFTLENISCSEEFWEECMDYLTEKNIVFNEEDIYNCTEYTIDYISTDTDLEEYIEELILTVDDLDIAEDVVQDLEQNQYSEEDRIACIHIYSIEEYSNYTIEKLGNYWWHNIKIYNDADNIEDVLKAFVDDGILQIDDDLINFLNYYDLWEKYADWLELNISETTHPTTGQIIFYEIL